MAKTKTGSQQVIVRDRISSLPDHILHRILSFLPTKEVVATCLLSKGWRSLWLSMSSFDFDDSTFYCHYDFIQFVDAVLLLADLKPVEKVRFRCGKFGHRLERSRIAPKINIWIKTLINRKVERLELFSSLFCIEVTSQIFNCDTLRVLNLDGVIVNIPSSVRLPSLKVFHLVAKKLPNHESLTILLSGCAFLEELSLDHWERDDEEEEEEEEEEETTVNIEKFEYLVSANVPSFLIPLKALTNVTHLRLNVDQQPAGDIPIFYNLTHLEISNLNEVHLNWMLKFLRSCPKLEILVINEIYCDEELWMEPTQDVPQCLSSHLKEFNLGRYEACESEFEFARYIMKNARGLRTVSICTTDTINLYTKYDWLNDLASCPRGSEHCRLLFK